MSAANITPRLEWAASAPNPIDAAHHFAMAAKECTFTAQDAVSRAWTELATPDMSVAARRRRTLLKKIERRLAKVRRELEELDNDWRGAQ